MKLLEASKLDPMEFGVVFVLYYSQLNLPLILLQIAVHFTIKKRVQPVLLEKKSAKRG